MSKQWAVNKAVHYNEWANFGKKDFEPVVTAFRELMDCFRCKDCQSWLTRHLVARIENCCDALQCHQYELKVQAKVRASKAGQLVILTRASSGVSASPSSSSGRTSATRVRIGTPSVRLQLLFEWETI